jgi:hypothetical protein
MQVKWLGLAILVVSALLGSVMAANVQVFERKESYAQSVNDQTPIVDRIVPVPPLNRTEGDLPFGWIGFNITLPNQGKAGYEAYGIILPSHENERPQVIMRIVNATPGGGFDLVIFDKFSEQAWNASRVYTVASLPSWENTNQYYDEFWFVKPDNASKYCVFFRGMVNATDDLNVLLTIKEAYLEPRTLIPATLPYAAVIGTVGLAGSILIVIGLVQTDKKRSRKRSTNTASRKIYR